MDPLHVGLITLSAVLFVVLVHYVRQTIRLRGERDLLSARIEAESQQRTQFQAVASEVLRSSTDEFLKLARASFDAQKSEVKADVDQRRRAVDDLIKPMSEALNRTQGELERMGRMQVGLREELVSMSRGHRELRTETSRLVQALRKPNVRGRYGEIQLERVIELAGMRSYCDFTPQENLRDSDGRLQKPDVIVRLPNSRILAIDAKTSIDAYLDALDARSPEEADALLERYADNVMEQAKKLARKAYWTNFEASPEFVVMFVPGDQLIDAALERRSELIEYAAEHNVVLASPSTLIGLLRAVHVGWREKNLTDGATELYELGRELHRRAATVLDHAARVGTSIESARRSYNDFVGSVQSRLVPSLRRFEERDARSSKEIPNLEIVEGEVRPVDGLLPLEDDALLPAPPPSPPSKEEREGPIRDPRNTPSA